MISQNVWAPPGAFGPWVNLESHIGDIAYTVYFESISQLEGPFVAFIWYAPNGPKTVTVIGPASFQIVCRGAGQDKIKFKSISGTGQGVHVYTNLA
ncbi:colicin Z C-terminal domain-related protein [Serratia marcescens]|uniref:colicin Z C-terminal domain-related protein n=1 Tax=Serratia marcescens TaxID=615 RepID=UPI0009F4C804|nr:colicin Z C-terminal domain-related protein [Serratia marcescens]NIA32663.1 hypothetical protein [Serratia marcescens]OQV35698.1 hypothetical protein BV901_08830 [Serratia nematodiphila]PIN53353.1 hypothetical protein CUB91_22410 [Serratia marcescens]HEI9809928.1 hypothetical protein [Serratia marcescens]